MTLLETGTDTSVFRGLVYLHHSSALIDDGLLQAAAGESLEVAYAHDVFAHTATATAGDSSAAGLIIARSELPDADVGIAYGPLALTALNATPPLLWEVAAGDLPQGMHLLANGTLAGVPTAAGVFPISIRLQDADSVVVKNFTLSCRGLTAPLSGYRLAWRDEFNGTSLDQDKWQYRTDTRFWSTQRPENVSVADGMLHLHLKKETVGSTAYTAGGVISRGLFRYGYYEARLKVPPGSGWHTSFWMMRYQRPAGATVAIELDVIENDSVTTLKYGVNVHRHLPLPHLTYGNTFPSTPSLSDHFHVFSCEFTPERIRYFFEGTLVQTVDATQFDHDDLNIWLTSIAAPLGGTTYVDDSQLPGVALFDWVRFYEPFAAPAVSITDPPQESVTLPDINSRLHLRAEASDASGSTAVTWSCTAGPGTVTFTDPSSGETSATFSVPGEYTLQCVSTNEGGTTADSLRIGVASPVTLTLREGSHGYSHGATLIRSDQKSWNAGARDQLIVGRNSAPIRSVFSFDLSPISPGTLIHQVQLDLTSVGGSGTIGELQLRRLAASPVEGTGTADGSAGSNLGIGTGATWNTRTGGSETNDLWTLPGGDFDNDILTTHPGYDATLMGATRSLPDTAAFLATVRESLDSATPLNLILTSANEATATGFSRIASDDDPDESRRPALRLTITGNPLPTANPGLPPAPRAADEVMLDGSAQDAASSIWSSVSGPADVVFTDPTSPSTPAVFPVPGNYQLQLEATNSY
jgi:beta-glucanase (GH16 family)